MSKLNPRQREAVHYVDGPMLVLAGAGSGKTSVITRKIAYLIQQCDIPARHIAAVTFTNKAAKEMNERVRQLVQGKEARGLSVSTFHTLGLNILRKEYRSLGYKSGFTIFDQEDAKALIRDILIQAHDDDSEKVNLIQNKISEWKNDIVKAEQAVRMASEPLDVLCAQAYLRYEQALKAYNALDFDDLILLPAQLFTDNAEVLARWQSKIRYLLVDEYQDTNGAQYQLVKQLVGIRGGLTVVGDDDQSIYAWRGAKPENLALLNVDYPHLKIVKLEQNYRSTVRILNAANTVIANNEHVFEKKLWSDLGYGENIRVVRCSSEDAECERTVTDILDHKLRRNSHFGEYAILYRSNFQSRMLEIKLKAHQVPYKINGGTSFFSRNEVKDIMGYMRLLVNQDDDAAFLRIVNVPRRKIGTSTLEKLGTYATEREISLYAACEEFGLAQIMPASGLERLQEFTRWMDGRRRAAYEDDPIAAVKQLIQDIDYNDWLLENSSSPTVAERRMENVMTLIAGLNKTLEDSEAEDPIEDAISRMVLRDLMDRQKDEAEVENQVQLMTLHASKGLEFPYVYMISAEEGYLPHRNSIEDDNIEEERRLCYVGITRAQRELTISYASKRKSFGETFDCTPSRFLDELPQDDILWLGREGDVEQNKQRGGETLGGLKNLFG